jgi:hypothetical protein
MLECAPALAGLASENNMASSPTDRRVAVRLVRNAEAPFRSGVDLGSATLRDISATGVGLVLAEEVEPGQVISIDLPVTGSAEWRLKLVRVAHVTRQKDRWLVGGPFLQPLSDQELALLTGAARQNEAPS